MMTGSNTQFSKIVLQSLLPESSLLAVKGKCGRRESYRSWMRGSLLLNDGFFLVLFPVVDDEEFSLSAVIAVVSNVIVGGVVVVIVVADAPSLCNAILQPPFST